jgi:SAM-dependent methyltransferase
MNDNPTPNVDARVAEGFGREWSTFRQGEAELSAAERRRIFEGYFRIFPWNELPADGGVGIDIGCGTGRWSVLVAPRVKHLHLLDASSDALAVAKDNLSAAANVSFHLGSASAIPLPDRSLDFAFSLGVLHHVPDTEGALAAISAKLKPGAPFLVYLYYAFDNRPGWFRALWRLSDAMRAVLSRIPHPLRLVSSQIIALTVYWPLARGALLLERAGLSPGSLPLSWYRDKSIYVMKTDAYDRFCTSLEKRFTRNDIEKMLTAAGFENVRFSEEEPYWCAVATARRR